MAAEISDETIREIASHYEAILKLLGEDTTREGLVKTPMRAAKAMVFMPLAAIDKTLMSLSMMPFFHMKALGW